MTVLPPNSTLGVLGGGQLGRMFALAAHRLGFRVAVYSPDAGPPAGVVVDRHVQGEYDDLAAVEAFTREVDVVTFEFENVPAETATAAALHAPVRPDGSLLHAAQNRIREKNALRALGLPVAEFAEIHSTDDIAAAARIVPGPGILKTATSGYDGKGQKRVAGADELESAWHDIGARSAVIERLVPFDREISVVGARGLSGDISLYEPFENQHVDQILDLTLWPARISAATRDRALEVARAVLVGFDVVGVLCVEMFVTSADDVIVNEIAPRPHNSGHLTIEAHDSSQFEQQARAVAGLPLGSASGRAPAAVMANLLGDLWSGGEPEWSAVLREPGLYLHLYAKRDARPGRKMGHMTLTGTDRDELATRLRALRDALPSGR